MDFSTVAECWHVCEVCEVAVYGWSAVLNWAAGTPPTPVFSVKADFKGLAAIFGVKAHSKGLATLGRTAG
jgi:hypothetical protein